MVVLDAQVGAHGAQRARLYSAMRTMARMLAPACRASTRAGTPGPIHWRQSSCGRNSSGASSWNIHFSSERRLGIGPGFGVGHRDLRAVGQAGFLGGAGAAVDHHDVVARLAQPPGAGNSDDAATQYRYFHARIAPCAESGVGPDVRAPLQAAAEMTLQFTPAACRRLRCPQAKLGRNPTARLQPARSAPCTQPARPDPAQPAALARSASDVKASA